MLAERKPSLVTRVTGSTGTLPIPDSSARGIMWMVLNGLLLFLVVEYDVFSQAGLAALETVVIGVSYFLGGLWDRYVAPKLRATAVPYPIAPPYPAPSPLHPVRPSPDEPPLTLAGRIEAEVKALEDAR